jgi:hypothetical protein
MRHQIRQAARIDVSPTRDERLIRYCTKPEGVDQELGERTTQRSRSLTEGNVVSN